MATPTTISDRFHRALYERLAPSVDERMIKLATGSAANYEQYQNQVGFIEAMNSVLRICREIEADMYGRKMGETEQTVE